MMRKKLFPLAAILFIAAACSKENVTPPEEKLKANVGAISNATFLEYLGQGTSYGYVPIQTVTAQGGNLYVEFHYTVTGDVSRVKANGLAQLDVNNLSVGGTIYHMPPMGSGDSLWIYDITANIQSLTVSKAYPVGLSYNGQVTGSVSVTKRARNPFTHSSEFLGNFNFSKNFGGAVPPPPEE
jgi:hypothetical protein